MGVPLFGDVEDPERYLYHYTTREAALGSILPTQSLRFGLLQDTNDPRESKEWRFGQVLDGPEDADRPDPKAFSDEVARLAKGTCKVLCLTRDDPVGCRTPPEIFGRGFAHSRMWAQYAGGHSGVCLILDRERLASDIEGTLAGKGELWEGPVQYADEAPDEINAFTIHQKRIDELGFEGAVSQHIRDHRQPLFFRKNRDWADEWEYRWMLHSPPPAPEFVPIRGSLRGILLGHGFPLDRRPSVDYLVNTLFGGLPVAPLFWFNGSPLVAGEGISIRARYWAAGSPWADGSPGPPIAGS